MIFKSLASSSHGNSYIVSDEKTKLLIECGLPYKKLQKLAGFSLSEFKACLLTHEHQDHAKSVQDLIERGMDVYMSFGTAEALEVEHAQIIEAMEQFKIGSFDVVAFPTFHDAKEPLGFLIKSCVDGDILAFATDTVNLRYKFPGINILAIEANFDRTVLEKSEKLPDKKKDRITKTHMEIGVLCDYLKTLDLSKCREIHLLHLSDAMSREYEFIHKVKKAVPEGIRVTVCEK